MIVKQRNTTNLGQTGKLYRILQDVAVLSDQSSSVIPSAVILHKKPLRHKGTAACKFCYDLMKCLENCMMIIILLMPSIKGDTLP